MIRINRRGPIKTFMDSIPDTDECVVWPFNKTPVGYGKITRDKKSLLVHRLVCEHRNGPPKPGQCAAHSCGNPSCVNPKHLDWKSHKENCADKVLHGTQQYGEKLYNASLTNEKAIQVYRDQRPLRVIADEENISYFVVANIKECRSYKAITNCETCGD